jgi:hypothetical protein
LIGRAPFIARRAGHNWSGVTFQVTCSAAPIPFILCPMVPRCANAVEIPNLTRGDFVGLFIAMCLRKMMNQGGFLFLINAEATLKSPFRASISR